MIAPAGRGSSRLIRYMHEKAPTFVGAAEFIYQLRRALFSMQGPNTDRESCWLDPWC